MKAERRYTVAFCALGVVLVAVLLGYAFSSDPDVVNPVKGMTQGSDQAAVDGTSASEAGGSVAAGKTRNKPRRRWVEVDEFDGLTGQDRKYAEAVQAAMDTDDHRKIIDAAVAALASTNSSVRQDAVDALSWCGKDALAELTGLLADHDDDVRSSAINGWECALTEVDSPKLRYSAALAVMGTITEGDSLDSISGQFGNAAQEYIDAVDDESVQNERRVEVVQQLYGIIDGSPAICVEKAKEAYNDLTGYDWISVSETEKYLADPSNYEPPETE